MVSGVIEVTRNTLNEMSLSKDLPHNPIVQKVEIDNATGMPRISQFYNAPKFNIGFVPRTYNSHFDKDIEDQTTFALPLIDLSQRLKQTLSVSNYLVLGILLHRNHQLYLDQFVGAKILAIEVNEASQKNIRSLADYTRENPGAIC